MSKGLTPGATYALEKLGHAVHVLATAPGDARSRLVESYPCYFPIQPQDLPEELRADFEFVVKRLTKYPAEYPLEGSVNASCRRMINRTASELCRRLVKVHEGLVARASESAL